MNRTFSMHFVDRKRVSSCCQRTYRGSLIGKPRHQMEGNTCTKTDRKETGCVKVDRIGLFLVRVHQRTLLRLLVT
jgi:hypothetical protein